jgi:hypothetical protein
VTQDYAGRSRYRADYQSGPFELLVAVSCLLGDLPVPTYGLLDTAAYWCILPPELAEALGYHLDPTEQPVRLQTRMGPLEGHLERCYIRFPAEEGDQAEMDATFFVCAEWPGPLVIGWKGALERIRFGLDPDRETFCFGSV